MRSHHMTRRHIFSLITLLLSGTATGVCADTLYKCIDGSGLVLYTNQKTGAKK